MLEPSAHRTAHGEVKGLFGADRVAVDGLVESASASAVDAPAARTPRVSFTSLALAFFTLSQLNRQG